MFNYNIRSLVPILCLTLLAAGCGEDRLTGPTSVGNDRAVSIPDLSAAVWTLRSMEIAGVGSVALPAADNFTVSVAADGRLAVKADCNRCSGGYSASASRIGVGLLACTRAYCVDTAPVDDQFLSVLQGDSSASIDGASLTLQSSRGTLRFTR